MLQNQNGSNEVKHLSIIQLGCNKKCDQTNKMPLNNALILKSLLQIFYAEFANIQLRLENWRTDKRTDGLHRNAAYIGQTVDA